MPITCSGRWVAAASRVMEMLDVLDARIAGFHQRIQTFEQLLLDVLVLDNRFHHQIRVLQAPPA